MNPKKNSHNFDINENLSVYKLLKWGELHLDDKSIANPFNESASILGYVLKKSLDEILVSYENKVDRDRVDLFRGLIARRKLREPYAYITKKKEFYSLPFFVDRSVLIPRPDTECLVEETLMEIKRLQRVSKKKLFIIDLGTGSGAIAVSIAKNTDNVIIYAADSSLEAMDVARRNIALNGVEDKVILTYLDMLRPDVLWINETTNLFDTVLLQGFDIIVSNPPYIKTEELNALDDDVRLYEPIGALDGGSSGLRFYEKIFELVSQDENRGFSKLKNGKYISLILEIDYREKDIIKLLCEEKFYDIMHKQIDFINDLNKRERAVKIKIWIK